MKRRKMGIWLMLIVSIMLLAGCGKEDGVLIFMSDEQAALSREGIDVIQEQLAVDLPDTKVEFNYSAMHNVQKVLVEYAAGGNSIMILPEDMVKLYGKDGAHLVLDDYFDKADYPDGVFESGILKDGEKDAVLEEHLFGIPVKDMKMFQDAGYVPENMLACVLVNAEDQEAAIKILQKLTEG